MVPKLTFQLNLVPKSIGWCRSYSCRTSIAPFPWVTLLMTLALVDFIKHTNRFSCKIWFSNWYWQGGAIGFPATANKKTFHKHHSEMHIFKLYKTTLSMFSSPWIFLSDCWNYSQGLSNIPIGRSFLRPSDCIHSTKPWKKHSSAYAKLVMYITMFPTVKCSMVLIPCSLEVN